MIGLFPPLEIVEKKLPHHLRFIIVLIIIIRHFSKNHYENVILLNRYEPVSNESVLNPGLPTKIDLIAERRRAKAIKVFKIAFIFKGILLL